MWFLLGSLTSIQLGEFAFFNLFLWLGVLAELNLCTLLDKL